MPHCYAVKSLPEHALSYAEGVSMTMLFITVCDVMERRNIPIHEKSCTSMKSPVIVSGANDLTAYAGQCHGIVTAASYP
jgi:hypothetical protein